LHPNPRIGSWWCGVVWLGADRTVAAVIAWGRAASIARFKRATPIFDSGFG
jgi:hypothetical protein